MGEEELQNAKAISESGESRLPRQITDGLILPVIAAPMFLVSGPDLVIAACRAGIIGCFPAHNARTIEILEEWLDTITADLAGAADSAIWSFNLTTHRSYTRLDAELDLVRRYRPPLVITALGSPANVIDAVHDYGGLVFADVNSIAFAKRAVDAGVDGLVLVAAGAGGHTGHITPFAFVPAVREFWEGPIVLGGGISNGRSVRALQMLGADLAYMGTRFIPTPESMATNLYRKMVVESGADDLVATNAFTGVTANMLRASIRRAGLDPDNLMPRTTINFEDPHEAEAKKPWKDIWSAGQGIGVIHDIKPVADVVTALAKEYRNAVATECETPPWPGFEV